MDFGEAVRLLKAGGAVSRLGWNGANQFIYYVGAGNYPAKSPVARAHFGEEALVPYRPYLAIRTVQGDVVPWLASQSDILADDWIEVGLGHD